MVDRGSAIAITPDGLRVQSREQKEWHGTRCTRGVRGGKWGFEAMVTDEGLCRVGWSTLDATLDLGTDRCRIIALTNVLIKFLKIFFYKNYILDLDLALVAQEKSQTNASLMITENLLGRMM